MVYPLWIEKDGINMTRTRDLFIPAGKEAERESHKAFSSA